VNYKLESPKPLYRQISNLIEKRILSGDLEAGDRLPASKKMAEEFGTTLQTIQQAAALLTRRGLIERTPGRGSFISNRIQSRTIVIACGANIFGDIKFLYYQQLYACLCQELKRGGWNTNLYFPLDENSPGQMLAELGQVEADGRIRGIIPICGNKALTEWLDEHPGIPRILKDKHQQQSTADPKEGTVYRAVDYLLGRGYRRIAVITHSGKRESKLTKKHIAQAYEDRNVSLQATLHTGKTNTHAKGVEQARNVLDQSNERPDALLVLNDLGCMGVIFELLCRKLNIPGDIGIMACSNKGIGIPCPVPLTRLEYDPMNMARREIEELMALIEGRESKQIFCGANLIIGKSCGE